MTIVIGCQDLSLVGIPGIGCRSIYNGLNKAEISGIATSL